MRRTETYVKGILPRYSHTNRTLRVAAETTTSFSGNAMQSFFQRLVADEVNTTAIEYGPVAILLVVGFLLLLP